MKKHILSLLCTALLLTACTAVPDTAHTEDTSLSSPESNPASENTVPLTADFVTEQTALPSEHFRCVFDEADYAFEIGFFPTEKLSEVCLYRMTFGEIGQEIAGELGAWPSLTPKTPLVARIAFPGDLSSYCISFRDSGGTVRYYSVMLSGRDGSVVLSEFTVK